MSMPNRLAKAQRLARKRKRKQETRLKRSKRRGGWFDAAPDRLDFPEEPRSLSFGAPGGVKMSDVLGEFVKPYVDFVDGIESYRRLLTLAVLAWNAALAAEAQREAMVDQLLREGLRDAGEEWLATGREIVGQLILRKQRFFAGYRRPILNFSLEDRGDHCYLTVASALVV